MKKNLLKICINISLLKIYSVAWKPKNQKCKYFFQLLSSSICYILGMYVLLWSISYKTKNNHSLNMNYNAVLWREKKSFKRTVFILKKKKKALHYIQNEYFSLSLSCFFFFWLFQYRIKKIQICVHWQCVNFWCLTHMLKNFYFKFLYCLI